MRYQCDNCDWECDHDGDITPLDECEDLLERLDVGGIVPVGDCPECRCFCYDHAHEYQYNRAAFYGQELLEACKDSLAALKVLSPACYDGVLGDKLRNVLDKATVTVVKPPASYANDAIDGRWE